MGVLYVRGPSLEDISVIYSLGPNRFLLFNMDKVFPTDCDELADGSLFQLQTFRNVCGLVLDYIIQTERTLL